MNTGMGGAGGTTPQDSIGDTNMGAGENAIEHTSKPGFELAPNAVTFSFLAALKKERRKCRL